MINLTEEDSLELEEFLIKEIGLKNLCNQNYFNGGKSGYKHSKISKLKMSKSKKNCIPWNKGKKNPEQSIRMLGKNNPMYGKKVYHTKETRDKLRKKNGTLVCDLYTGIFYDSIEEMKIALNSHTKRNDFKIRIGI